MAPSTASVDHPAIPLLRRVLAVLLVLQVAGMLFSIALSSIAFALAVPVGAIILILRRRHGWPRSGLEWYLVAFAAAAAVSVVFAIHPMQSLSDARRLLLATLVFLVPLVVDDERTLLRMLLVLALAAGIQAGIELVTFVLRAADRLGSFQHYMTSAGIKMLLALLFLPVVFDRRVDRRLRLTFGSVLVLLVVSLVLTQTRSSWLGFGAGAVVAGMLAYRWILAALAGAVLLFALLAGGALQERVNNMFATQQGEQRSSTVASNQYRMRMWQTGWRMFLSDPLTGVGEGEMYRIYRTWVKDAHEHEGGHLHNTYIHILATHGAPGALALLALLWAVARVEWRAWKRARAGLPRALAMGALAGFTAFLVNGMAEYNFGDHEIMVLVWCGVGIALAASSLGPGGGLGTTHRETAPGGRSAGTVRGMEGDA